MKPLKAATEGNESIDESKEKSLASDGSTHKATGIKF